MTRDNTSYEFQLETDSIDFVFNHISSMYNKASESIVNHEIFITKNGYIILYKLK